MALPTVARFAARKSKIRKPVRMIGAVHVKLARRNLSAVAQNLSGPGIGLLRRHRVVQALQNPQLVADVEAHEALVVAHGVHNPPQEQLLRIDHPPRGENVPVLALVRDRHRHHPRRQVAETAHPAIQNRDLHIEAGAVRFVQQ